MPANQTAALTEADEAALLARGATIHFDRASVRVRRLISRPGPAPGQST